MTDPGGPGSSIGRPSLAGARILVAEDDDLVREAIADILALLGASAAVACTVAEGQAAARTAEAPFDVVVVDLGLPDAPMVDALAPWAAACPGAALVVTSGADREDVLRRVGPGSGWSLLAKPFGLRELTDALARALDGPDRR